MRDSKPIKEGIPKNASLLTVTISTNFKSYTDTNCLKPSREIEAYFNEESGLDYFFEKRFRRIIEGKKWPFFKLDYHKAIDKNETFYVGVYASDEDVEEVLDTIGDECKGVIVAFAEPYKDDIFAIVGDEEIPKELKALED